MYISNVTVSLTPFYPRLSLLNVIIGIHTPIPTTLELVILGIVLVVTKYLGFINFFIINYRPLFKVCQEEIINKIIKRKIFYFFTVKRYM